MAVSTRIGETVIDETVIDERRHRGDVGEGPSRRIRAMTSRNGDSDSVDRVSIGSTIGHGGGGVDLNLSNVQSVERAFSILGALAAGPVGVSDLAERTGLPKSTVSRLLVTLVDLGAVERAELAGGYALGGLLVDLASAASPERNLVAMARPLLQQLVEDLGEASGIGMLDGSVVHYYDQIDADHQVQIRDWTGESVDFHVVASGLLLAAHVDTRTRSELLDRPLESWTEHSMTDPDHLARRFDQIVRDGFVWTHEEMAEGLNSVAAPVRNAAGTVVAAIHAHGPSYRFPGDRDRHTIAGCVIQVADQVSDRLAGRLTDAHQSLTD